MPVKKTPKKTNQSSMIGRSVSNARVRTGLFAAAFAIIGAVLLFRARAATPMWLPTADKPLRLAWVLGGGATGSNVMSMQLKDLKGNVIPSADVYDLDGEMTTKEAVDVLHANGKKAICYFDAGVYETYRSDASKFPKSVIGAKDQGWDGSYWLDIRQISVLEPIMRARIKMCVDKGFDSIEPDEITNYSNNSGFPLTYQDQIKYNTALAGWAHEAGISIGLKGDIEQAQDLAKVFDWTLNEECYAYGECTSVYSEGKQVPGLQEFTKLNKAVWIAEYPLGDNGGADSYTKFRDPSTPSQITQAKFDAICNDSIKNRFNTAFYVSGLPLNSGRTDCPPFPARGGGTTTPTNPTVSLALSAQTATAPAAYTVTATSSLPATITISQASTVVKTCSAATSCVHSASNMQAGTYNYSAKASTADGGSGFTATQSVTVNPGTVVTNKPPTVTLTAANTQLTAPATVGLSATAADSDGSIAKVEFYQNGSLIGTDTSTPYSFASSNVAAGSYNYTAKAYDNSGASASSNSVTVNVQAPVSTDTQSPTQPMGLNASLNFDWSAGGYKLIAGWQASTDDSGKVGYNVGVNGGQPVRTTATNYTVKSPAAGSAYKFSVQAVDASGNVSPTSQLTVTPQCFLFWCWL